MSKFNTTLEAKHGLIEKGYSPVFTVEVQYAGFKHDQYGLDVIGYHPSFGWVGVQACTESDFATHKKEFDDNKAVRPAWIDLGFRFEFWIYPNKADREEGDTEPRMVVVATPPPKKTGGK